jgi:hypothetical protein
VAARIEGERRTSAAAARQDARAAVGKAARRQRAVEPRQGAGNALRSPTVAASAGVAPMRAAE